MDTVTRPARAMAPPTLVAVLVLFGSLQTGENLVISSKLDLPSPSAIGLDSSLSPKLVKAFYEVNFVPVNYEGLHDKIGEATITMQDPASPQTVKNCKYPSEFCKNYFFVPTKVSTVQKVEDMIRDSSATEGPKVVAPSVGFGETESGISDLFDEFNKTVNRVVTITSKYKPTTNNATQHREVPVYKGVIDTKTVLEKEEVIPATHRPLAKPYYPSGRPFYESPFNRQNRPGYRPWRENPCLRNPCPPEVWLKAPYPAVNIDTKLN
ncbi:hypothetical protein AAG570_002249 [Ranatra chinensis]|uniref:Uncharacterized protein n=1 Tax=Ranatra chinensis TaxID=642074 RepID=A0ABD0YJ97_9HEMI